MPIKKWFGKFKIIFPLIAAVIFMLPKPVRANPLFDLATDSVMNIMLTVINFVVNFVGNVLISIASSIVNYAFSFQNFVKVPVVQIGWTLSRDLANMMFILVLLSIAFAYILRLETFGMKKLLPKLIIMALVLNFSLVVCGVFIDIGNSMGRFFVSGGQTANVGDNIMAAVKAGQLAQMRNSVKAGSPVSTLIMASVMQLIFYIILAFLLFAMGFMMLYRIINLWLLIILAPLAWICIAVPQMGSYYTSWWSRFLKQSFFPAVLGFFIFLGLLTGSTFFGSDISQGVKDVGGWGYILPETFFSSIMQFIVVVFILFIGLTTSQKWGTKGADTMMKWAESSQKWATGKITTKAKMIGGQAAQYAAFNKAGPRAGIKGLSRIPLVGKAVQLPLGLIADRKKQLAEYDTKYEKMSPDMLGLLWNRANPDERVAIANSLAKKGRLKETPGLINKDSIADTMKRAVAVGAEKEMIMAAPEIAISNNIINNNAAETVARVEKIYSEIKPEDIKKIGDGVFGRLKTTAPTAFKPIMEIALKNWSNRHIASMADAGFSKNLQEIENHIKSLGTTEADRLNALETLAGNKKLRNYLAASPGGKDIIDLT